jgi:site-specific recombinase XerD
VVLPEEEDDLERLPLRDILGLLLGKEGKRMLSLRTKSSEELFALWQSELAFRYRSQYALKEAYRILGAFQHFLGGYPPSAELAKSYLAQFLNRKTSTIARYTNIIAQFMKWYGDSIDVSIKRPKQLPQLTDPRDSDKLEEAMRRRKTHKRKTDRDVLLLDTFRLTGLRRGELANLRVEDLDFTNRVLLVRAGKGEKDRSIPLSANLSSKLEKFCQGRGKEESVFGLAAVSISDKISRWASKAGCPHIHVHSLRHEFATQLARQGVDARRIQLLLGHSSMETSQQYIDLIGGDLRDAVELLDNHHKPEPDTPLNPVSHKMSWELPQYQSRADRERHLGNYPPIREAAK